MKDIEIVIPVHTTRHPMLMECVRNVRETTGTEPVVWESPGNVSVARNGALDAVDAKWVCFLDTDAFPQGRDWHLTLMRSAEADCVSIANPNEVFDFGTHTTALGSRRMVIDSPDNCGGFCLLVDRTNVTGRFDENIGYESDFLGPCLEDTDFAKTVCEHGGTMLLEPSVTVLHRDRGTADVLEFINSHEGFCYAVVSSLIDMKHHLGLADLFSGIGKVPGCGRYLADGYTKDRLIECYAPVLANLPEKCRPGMQRHIELLSTQFFRD